MGGARPPAGSVAEVAITGCTIQHSKEAPESANIRILGRGFMQRRGENMPFQCGNVTIGDNVLSDVQTNIHLVGVRGARAELRAMGGSRERRCGSRRR